MNDYLSNLVARQLGRVETFVRPRLASRFEPPHAGHPAPEAEPERANTDELETSGFERERASRFDDVRRPLAAHSEPTQTFMWPERAGLTTTPPTGEQAHKPYAPTPRHNISEPAEIESASAFEPLPRRTRNPFVSDDEEAVRPQPRAADAPASQETHAPQAPAPEPSKAQGARSPVSHQMEAGGKDSTPESNPTAKQPLLQTQSATRRPDNPAASPPVEPSLPTEREPQRPRTDSAQADSNSRAQAPQAFVETLAAREIELPLSAPKPPRPHVEPSSPTAPPETRPQKGEQPRGEQPRVLAEPHITRLSERHGSARAEAGGEPAAAPVINITIGRVEVRATRSAAATQPRAGSAAPSMSLEDYLRQRAGGGGRK